MNPCSCGHDYKEHKMRMDDNRWCEKCTCCSYLEVPVNSDKINWKVRLRELGVL